MNEKDEPYFITNLKTGVRPMFEDRTDRVGQLAVDAIDKTLALAVKADDVRQALWDLLNRKMSREDDDRYMDADVMVDILRGDAMAWQPIDTAPTDGTHVLLFANMSVVGYASWRRGREFPVSWVTLPAERWIDPTHWMPLPEPPK
jgi:hypothetical protein